MRWSIHLQGGLRRVNHAAVRCGDRIFSFGGMCSDESLDPDQPIDVHILNTTTYQWTALPLPSKESDQYKEAPYQRYGHVCFTWQRKIFVLGGRNDHRGACNTLHCFDTDTYQWTRPEMSGDIPGPRNGHAVTLIDDKMYMFGGYDGSVERFSNDMYTLDMKSMRWTLLHTRGRPARWRDFHTITAIGDKILVFGGRCDRGGPFHTNNEIYCNRIMMFDTITECWSEPPCTGEVPSGRRSHSAWLHNNQLYIFGGYNGLHNIHFGEIHKFDPVNYHWSNLNLKGESPCARRRQCCCMIGDRLFLFGGTSPIHHPMNIMERGHRDHGDLFILDYSPSLKMLCSLIVIQEDLDQTILPKEIKEEISSMTKSNTITKPLLMSTG